MKWTPALTATALSLLTGCGGIESNSPGIDAKERPYLFMSPSLDPNQPPTDEELHTMFRRAEDPGMAGERALYYRNDIREALFLVGDKRFTERLRAEPKDVIARILSWVDPERLESGEIHNPKLLELDREFEGYIPL